MLKTAKNGAEKIPPQMRALILDGIGFEHLAVKKTSTPRPGPRQMLARVEAAGICTSLIKLVEQGPAHNLIYGWDVARFPLILGDEGAVTIVEVGEALRGRYCPGESFVIQPAVATPRSITESAIATAPKESLAWPWATRSVGTWRNISSSLRRF